jgi:hypothetical protein
VDGALDRLERLHLVESHSPSYSATGVYSQEL